MSDVLRDLRLRSVVVSISEFRAPWGFEKPDISGAAPFHIVIDGRCMFAAPDGSMSELAPGDMVIVCHGEPHGLQADQQSARIPFPQLLQEIGISSAWNVESRMGPLPRFQFGGNGRSTTILSGIFTFGKTRQNPLSSSLPSVIRVKVAVGQTFDGIGGVDQLIAEAEEGRPGFQSIAERMAEVLFVQAVRNYVASMPDDSTGWLRGLADPQIAQVLSLVHAQPSTPWTIASLAKAVGLSRTILANRFRQLIGSTVIAYATSQRMAMAADMLTTSSLSMAVIASAVGYESEISFSRAFRDWSGMPPGKYRRLAHAKGAA
ncbi:AraC family transcriptional regulator [Mesorhizobium carmichaelinearum]|uniref:AraC family transcriptional regulator n=1 Tax=Mesorhizobium carmichaelinearum TaxID=1208188 RepID=UPI0015C6CD2F|nr:AraC family transcriptional regulator [Mesorhizobium carmichaelinearum]